MKRKVLSLFLCCCFCCCLFSLNSSAVEYDEETGRLIWSDEELQQFGAVFDEDGNYYFPVGTYPPDELYAVNPLLVTEPYNSTFDMYQLPWESFPSAVKDIVYMNLDGYALSETDLTKYIIPFVVMIVSQTAVEIYAGTNLCLGMRGDYGRLCICSLPYHSVSGIYSNAKCFYAKYRLSDYSVVSDWKLLTPLAWGDSGKVNYYMRFPLTEDEYDVYIYGGAGAVRPDYIKESVDLSDTSKATFFNDFGVGYESGRYFDGQANFAMCWQYFYPPTIDELEAKTDKSILQTLRELPSNIAEFFSEKLKALFIPSDEFMNEYKASFQAQFSGSLGLLYEIPEFTIDILEQLVDFEPLKEGYYIQIPNVKLPIRHEDGEYRDFQIFNEQKYYFDFLDEGAIGVLYSFYRAFMWLLSIFALMRFAIRKYDKVIGSGSG